MASTPTTATASSGEMCRLTIFGPNSRVELAVPAHVPLTDLMPTVVGHLDPALATTGLAHGGWVLQRLGEPPLDEDQGTAAAGLYDGDVLHLRPRDDLLPLVDFDDLVDGVHTGLSKNDDMWRPALTRSACVAVMGVCATTSVLVAALTTVGWAAPAGTGVLAAALLAAAAVVSRIVGDRTSSFVLACIAVFAAGLAGLTVPSGGGHWLSGPGALAAGTAVAVIAVAARFLLTAGTATFLAVAAAGTLTAVGGAIMTFGGLTAAASASIVVTVAVLLTKMAPSVAAKAAGLAVEAVPTTAEEFQQGLEPLPSEDVLSRAQRADALLTAMLAALGVVTTTGLVAVSAWLSWDATAFTATMAVLLLLHARELPGTWHRLSALVPATAGLVALACGWAGQLAPSYWVVVLVVLLAGAFAALAGAHLLPGRRLVPRWGRWGDILHWLCALAVVPLVLALSDVYSAVADLVS